MEKFAARVLQYKMELRKKSFFAYGTGPSGAYPELDAVSAEIVALRKECANFTDLASIFEFAQMVGTGAWRALLPVSPHVCTVVSREL